MPACIWCALALPFQEPHGGLTEGRLSNRPEGNRLNHGVCFCSDDSDTPFLAVALAILGLLELSLALGLG